MNNIEIQANAKGTRKITVNETDLKTIEKYGLFRHLVDSHGIIDDMVLVKLQMNVSSLMNACPNDKELLDLCANVIFHNNMKAYGLEQLVDLYSKRQATTSSETENTDTTE